MLLSEFSPCRRSSLHSCRMSCFPSTVYTSMFSLLSVSRISPTPPMSSVTPRRYLFSYRSPCVVCPLDLRISSLSMLLCPSTPFAPCTPSRYLRLYISSWGLPRVSVILAPPVRYTVPLRTSLSFVALDLSFVSSRCCRWFVRFLVCSSLSCLHSAPV